MPANHTTSHSQTKQSLAFYTPMVLYFLFILVFLVTRLLLLSLLTGNAALTTRYLPRQFNLVPLQTVQATLWRGTRWQGLLDVTANVLLTVPLGAYIHALGRRQSVPASAAKSLLAITCIEGSQFVLATGSFDVDDILLNFAGALLGIGAYHLIFHLCHHNNTLSKRVLSAVSVPLLPILAATVVQYALWLPRLAIVPGSLAAFCLFDVAAFSLFRQEDKRVRATYLFSCVAFCALFLLFVLPMLSPSARG